MLWFVSFFNETNCILQQQQWQKQQLQQICLRLERVPKINSFHLIMSKFGWITNTKYLQQQQQQTTIITSLSNAPTEQPHQLSWSKSSMNEWTTEWMPDKLKTRDSAAARIIIVSALWIPKGNDKVMRKAFFAKNIPHIK